ncbi:peroxiredoxin-like family protein [Mangrovimonas sp. TPBH4]|uniref:peroxiredoxin-like family protein n=1 Tax=Mangrovimonas sp. TPBH4 TaxID=1645914 RepID=UPI0009EB5F2B|nr:peroxiredoxin-like family protein [Mangrovimonas sp. TPBH4]
MTSKLLILFSCFTLMVQSQIPKQAEDVSPLLVGETIPKAKVLDLNGDELSLQNLIKEKPTVLVFYRGGWCPYCNTQLGALAEAEKEILDLGYQIIAISPDHFKNLRPTVFTHAMKYQVYADPDAKLIQEVGIGFETPGMAKMYIANKTKMDATEVLPVPSVFVLNTSGDILFEYINPNYKVRLSTPLLLAVLETLKEDM